MPKDYDPPPFLPPFAPLAPHLQQRAVMQARQPSSETGATQSPRFPDTWVDEAREALSPCEPAPSLALRQEQQELRIQALHAKLRHLENQVSSGSTEHGVASRHSPGEQAFNPSPGLGLDFDRLLENELSTFKQELKALHMEHNLGMVQEANVLRQDVSQALRNEREARG